MDASGYLYTIATVGMTFAGLSVLTMILRQMLGGRMTKWDSFVTRTWIQLGFMTTFGSILPPLLILFGPTAPIAWRVSSGVMAVILGSWALTFPRRRLAVNPTHLPLQVVIYSLAMDIAALHASYGLTRRANHLASTRRLIVACQSPLAKIFLFFGNANHPI